MLKRQPLNKVSLALLLQERYLSRDLNIICDSVCLLWNLLLKMLLTMNWRHLCINCILIVQLVNCVSGSASSDVLDTLDVAARNKSVIFVNATEESNSVGGNPNSVHITSENYPFPYPVKKFFKMFSVEDDTSMDIIINDLDIDPNHDYLTIAPWRTGGIEGRPIVLTGKLKQPLSIRLLGYSNANLTFQPATVVAHGYRGFSLTYNSYAPTKEGDTKPTGVRLSLDQLPTAVKLLVVPKENQTDDMWHKIKDLLTSTINLYLKSANLTYEPVSSKNISLTRVAQCFSSWPNSQDCVEVEFAATLYNDSREVSYLESLNPREPISLSRIQLDDMWELHGRNTFLRNGIIEYDLPDTKPKVLMWISIVIGTCAILLFIFVGVFRSSAFNKRWGPKDSEIAQTKDENISRPSADITMYPSPNQFIPDMSPTINLNESNVQLSSRECSTDRERILPTRFELVNEAYIEEDAPTRV